MTTTSLDRAKGCLFGQLAGDALGSLVEFRSRSSIAAQYPEGPHLLADGGTWGTIAGQPTDDSEMALALARSIIGGAGYDPAAEAAGKAYIDWYNSAPFDMGATTATGIRALKRGERSTSVSQANGALMRVSPIGIAAGGNPALAADWAEADARLTHPSSVCRSCNRAYAAAIASLIAGASNSEAIDVAFSVISREDREVWATLTAARDGSYPVSYSESMGWVLIAFQNAFAWLAAGDPLEMAVVETVRGGGDTDTNGAIVGALLGAAQGLQAVPKQWQDAITGCRPGELTPRPRPVHYWPCDAHNVAAFLLEKAGLIR